MPVAGVTRAQGPADRLLAAIEARGRPLLSQDAICITLWCRQSLQHAVTGGERFDAIKPLVRLTQAPEPKRQKT